MEEMVSRGAGENWKYETANLANRLGSGVKPVMRHPWRISLIILLALVLFGAALAQISEQVSQFKREWNSLSEPVIRGFQTLNMERISADFMERQHFCRYDWRLRCLVGPRVVRACKELYDTEGSPVLSSNWRSLNPSSQLCHRLTEADPHPPWWPVFTTWPDDSSTDVTPTHLSGILGGCDSLVYAGGEAVKRAPWSVFFFVGGFLLATLALVRARHVHWEHYALLPVYTLLLTVLLLGSAQLLFVILTLAIDRMVAILIVAWLFVQACINADGLISALQWAWGLVTKARHKD
jgi:hypothetical protein